jgi:hypothetical protein
MITLRRVLGGPEAVAASVNSRTAHGPVPVPVAVMAKVNSRIREAPAARGLLTQWLAYSHGEDLSLGRRTNMKPAATGIEITSTAPIALRHPPGDSLLHSEPLAPARAAIVASSVDGDESLVIDERSDMSPAQMVEDKLARMLKDGSMPISCLQMRKLLGSR